MITSAIARERDYFGRIKLLYPVTVCYWLAMLATGTDLLTASLLATAVFFGLLSVNAAGGMKTVPGFLNFVLILKFVLIAVALKSLTLQASDSNLKAPRTTAEVMAVGFFALYLAAIVYRFLPNIKGATGGVHDSRTYLMLTLAFTTVCLGSAFLILATQTSYQEALTGGFWGILHQFGGSSSFCVIPAMYYAWSSGSKRFLSHPLVVVILLLELGWGLASTTKQGVMEPMLCYLAVAFIRYGLGSKVVWSVVAGSLLFYMAVIYPYSQYVRSHGGRDGTFAERLQIIQEVFLNVATDTDFREGVETQISSGDSYLNNDRLEPISRFAMIGEADRLIDATDETQSYTGWQTIIDGFAIMVPSFIADVKPSVGVANQLGHISGQLADDDTTTQISYGFMANLYNAFGLPGVLVGTVIFMPIFYFVLGCWFSRPTLTVLPFGSTIWYLYLGVSFEHGLVEAPIAYMMPGLINISAIVALIYLSKMLAKFFNAPRLSLAR